MTVRIGVVVFPGSNCDADTLSALRLAGADAVPLWHDQADLEGSAAIVVPGGFAFGDYLRAGVIARFSPIMRSVAGFASEGGLVVGICNGFQVLTEAGLLPGALLRNADLRFAGRWVRIAPERLDTPLTRSLADRRSLRMPVAHGEGRYHADPASLVKLEADRRIVFRYVDDAGSVAGPEDPANPNGSLAGIAGVMNAAGTVLGLMPHPERAAEGILGSDDGLGIVRSIVEAAADAARLSSAGSRAPVGAGA